MLTSTSTNRFRPDHSVYRRALVAVAVVAMLAAGHATSASVVAEPASTDEEPEPDPIGLWRYGSWLNPETNEWQEPDEVLQGIGYEFISGPEPVLYTGSTVLLDPHSAGDCFVSEVTLEAEIEPGDSGLVTPPGTSPVAAWEGTDTYSCGEGQERAEIAAALLDDGRLLIGFATFVRVGCAVPTSGFARGEGAPTCSTGCSRVEGSNVRIVNGPKLNNPHVLIPIPRGWTVDLARSNGLNCEWGPSGMVTISFQPRPSYSAEEYFAVGYNEVRVTLEWTNNPDQAINALACTDPIGTDAVCTDGEAGLPGGVAAWTEEYRLCLPAADQIAVVSLHAEGVALYDHPDDESRLEVRGVALYGAGPATVLSDFCDGGKSLSGAQLGLAGEFRSGLLEILGGVVMEEEEEPPPRPDPDSGCSGVEGGFYRIHDIGGFDPLIAPAADLLVPIPEGWEVVGQRRFQDNRCHHHRFLFFTKGGFDVTVRIDERLTGVGRWDRQQGSCSADTLWDCTVTNDRLPNGGNLSWRTEVDHCTTFERQHSGHGSVHLDLDGRAVLDHPSDESVTTLSIWDSENYAWECEDDSEYPLVTAEEWAAAATLIVRGARLVPHAD